MKYTQQFLILVICLFIPQFIYADFFRHIGREEGLSQSSVMSIYQDRLGRMWFGTREGLNIYNGNTMTVHKGWVQNVSNHPAEKILLGNEITAITGCGDDVYFVSEGALFRYDIRKESFDRLVSRGAKTVSVVGENVWCVIEDTIYRYDSSNHQFVFREKTNIVDINYILPDGKQFYIGARFGLFLTQEQDSPQCIIPGKDIYRIFKSSTHELWVASRTEGLFRVSREGVVAEVPYLPDSPHGVSSRQIREFVEDRKGNIWFGTFKGLQKYNPETDTYSLIRQEQHFGGLNHSSIFSLYQDMQGTIWIGSYYGGVNYFNPDNNAFTYYAYNPDRNDCLRYPFAGAMTEDKDGDLWICTDGGGLACLDRNTGDITTYTAGGANSFPYNNLKSICYDAKRDYLYIGTHMGGLSRYDRKNKSFQNYLKRWHKGARVPNDVIFQVSFYNDRLYISGRNGFYIMNPDTDEFRRLHYDGAYYQSFTFDNNGYAWLVGSKSLLRVNPNDSIDMKEVDLAPMGCLYRITNIVQGHDGRFYIGTLGSGLFCYDEETGECINYTSEKTKLLSDYCYNLLVTSQNNVLITSDRGITLFNPAAETFRSIELDNGLSLMSIIEGCGAYMCRDNRIFIGGTGGIASFMEKDLDLEYPEPHLFFTNLLINNSRIMADDDSGILQEAIPFVKSITLNHVQNNLTLEFASSNYVDILNNTWYEYKLEGFDDQWTLTSEPNLKYTNLLPGNYVLYVREKGNSFQMREVQGISLNICVMPPWYNTWWAWTVFLTVVILGCFWIYRIKYVHRTLALSLEKERIEKQHIEEMNQAKLRFFTNISHEFRTPLTLIISHVELLLQNKVIPPAIYNHILKISKHARLMRNLVSELLDFRKLEQNHVTLYIAEHNMAEFTRNVYQSFLEYALQRNIDFRFVCDKENIQCWYDGRQMEKVVYNLLSNAFKYTPNDGTITLVLSEQEETVCLEVTDTGTGIDPHELDRIFDRFYQANNSSADSVLNPGTGVGLALTESIVQLHHGDISVKSEVGKGTSFVVSLKKGRIHFENDHKVLFREQSKDESYVIKLLSQEMQEMEASSEQIEETLPSIEKKRYKVLLVEDNGDLIQILEELFSPLYQVILACNGEEGYEKAKSEKPDLIVSDVMMPVMTGTEMCLRIKNDIHLCHIPLVLLTALDSVEQSLEGFCRGADDYIAKPFNSQILLARCNNLIRNRLLLQNQFVLQPSENIELLASNPLDKAFLEKVNDVVEKHLDDTEFGIPVLCSELAVGRTLLHTKFKALTGMTPNDFILNYRLKQAAILLRKESYLQIAEIADRLGFSSPRYFTRCFKAQYGMSPLAFRKGDTKGDDTEPEEETEEGGCEQ